MKLILIFFLISFITIVGTSFLNKYIVKKREEVKAIGNEDLIKLGKHTIVARKELNSRIVFSIMGLIFIAFGLVLRFKVIIILGGIVILGQSTYFLLDIYNFVKLYLSNK